MTEDGTAMLEDLWQQIGIPQTALTEEAFKRLASLILTEGQAERDMWRSHYNHASNLLSATVRQRCDLQSERDRLQEMLRRYGMHAAGCDWFNRVKELPCTCGLDEILKGAE